MTIIGLFYLLLIIGWIFLILVLKCKRARAKRLAEEQAAAQAAQCHIIQIGSNYYDIIPSNHPFTASSYRSCSALHMDDSNDGSNGIVVGGEGGGNIHGHHHHHEHTNPAFLIDEVGGGGVTGGGIFPTNGTLPDLPPSYEDVMRLPSSYPKVAPLHTTCTRLNTAPSEMAPRYTTTTTDGPAIIEVTNIEPPRIDPNNNNNHHNTITHQTCTCNSNNINNNNNNIINNNSISVRRQSDTT